MHFDFSLNTGTYENAFATSEVIAYRNWTHTFLGSFQHFLCFFSSLEWLFSRTSVFFKLIYMLELPFALSIPNSAPSTWQRFMICTRLHTKISNRKPLLQKIISYCTGSECLKSSVLLFVIILKEEVTLWRSWDGGLT